MISGEPGEREIERDGGVRPDHPLDRRVRDVALVPERHVLERRHGVAAHQPREPGQVLRQHRVPLMRHGRGALLPLAEIFLGLEHLGPLQMPDLGRQPLDRARHDGERREIDGVAVARDDLGRHRLDR